MSDWLDAWLGGTEVTDEQRAALLAASDEAYARFPDADETDDLSDAFTEAAMVILGDAS